MPHARLLGLLVAASTLVPAASALAGPTVTVRIEGQDRTLLPATTVTLPDVKAPGNPCTDAGAEVTVGAALEEATKGNWDRQSFTQTILGETHNFSNNDYWAVWRNERFGNGLCVEQVQTGDRVLLLVDVLEPAPSFASTVFPLTLAAPARVAPATPFEVTATEHRGDGNPGSGTPTPAGGATVTGGATSATTDADGKATVTLTQRGEATLQAVRGRERTELVKVCVTDGADGFCGTALPGQPPAAVLPPAPGSKAPLLSEARITSVTEGARYTRARAPRLLGGKVVIGRTGLRDVRLRLSRTDAGRCSRFDGAAERFVRTARCGVKNARTFSVGADASWDYQLPSALPRGRYVLDVLAYDRNGGRDLTYERGGNRVVFFVR